MSEFIEPGEFYLFYGCMKSGKTKALIDHMDFVRFTDYKYSFFKPTTDTRDKNIKSRSYTDLTYKPIEIDASRPLDILKHIHDQKIVAIDEIQFFGEGIDKVVLSLLQQGLHVAASGLNLDFRGEVFNQMGSILPLATKPFFLTAVCEHKGCNKKATRTQRLINGQPAHYDEPVVVLDGFDANEIYQARCLEHHIVPKYLRK